MVRVKELEIQQQQENSSNNNSAYEWVLGPATLAIYNNLKENPNKLPDQQMHADILQYLHDCEKANTSSTDFTTNNTKTDAMDDDEEKEIDVPTDRYSGEYSPEIPLVLRGPRIINKQKLPQNYDFYSLSSDQLFKLTKSECIDLTIVLESFAMSVKLRGLNFQYLKCL